MASVLPYRPGTANGLPRRPSNGSVLSSKRSTSPPPPLSEPPPPPPKTMNGPFNAESPFLPRSTPSHHSSVVRRKRKVRPQYPMESEEKHVEYILVASFDIDEGSIMEHQYPAPIGGDEGMLAGLMLPDQAHVRSQDWTTFFLHKDTSEEDALRAERIAKRRKRKADREAREQAGAGAEKKIADTADEDIENDEDLDSDEEEDLASIQGPPLVYVLNLVNTKQDNTVRRGAVCKAMAICTRHPFLHIYKPLLLLALEEYFRSPVPETLALLYDAVNSMDLSLMPRLSVMERYILQASDARDLFVEKFETIIQNRMADPASEKTRRASVASSTMSRQQRYGLPRDTHEFECVVPYNGIPIPIKIPTAVSTETVGDFSLIQLIQTFSGPHTSSPQPFTTLHPHLTTSGPLTHPIIVLLNAVLTQKRVIFMGHNMPSSSVADGVLAACALASGGLLRGFVRHAFPYTDLGKIDDLQKVPGFIAGVTNPTFALHEEWWDLLCDLPTGRMRISPKTDQAPLTEGVAFFQNPSQNAILLQNSGLDQKGIAAMAAAGASLSAGLGGSNVPMAVGAGDATGDNAFMASVLQSVADRRGESAIRAKFRLWIFKFTRLAAAFEETVYGASALHVHSETVSPNVASGTSSSRIGAHQVDPVVTGYGYVWPSQAEKVKELAANATRIEGWMKTRSYYNFIQDLAVLYSYRPVKEIDLQHLHDKLARLRLGSEASASVYLAICHAVRSYEEINQLLVVTANTYPNAPSTGVQATGGAAGSGGGLFYLALGLFHPRVDVRESVAELLSRIRDHEAGRHFWAKLGGFEKAAWDRTQHAKQELGGA